MGLNTIGGAGVGLPSPQALYPVQINGSPQVSATNRISLPPGGSVLVPAGTWNIVLGTYSMLQFLDPVTNTWVSAGTADPNSDATSCSSDGTNYRLYNPLGFVIAANIGSGGTGYTSAPTVAASIGGATFQAVVGGSVGQLNITTVLSSAGLLTVAGGSGAGYSVPPIINIAAPPAPGVPATAVCTISGGQIATFTIVNPGAGYTGAPLVTVIPQPLDQNQVNGVAGYRPAGVTAALSGVGQITAVFVTNPGNNPLTVAPALTVSGGGGSGATLTAVVPRTMVNYTVTTGGSGYGTGLGGVMTFAGSLFTRTSGVGGQTNNTSMAAAFISPRQAMFDGSPAGTFAVSATANSGLIDGGIFTDTPGLLFLPQGATVATGAATLGFVSDTVIITPA